MAWDRCLRRDFVGKKVKILLLLIISICVTLEITDIISGTWSPWQLLSPRGPSQSPMAISSWDQSLRGVSKYKVVHSLEGLNMYIHTAIVDNRLNGKLVKIMGMQPKNSSFTDYFSCEWNAREGDPGEVTLKVQAHWQLIDPNWPHWSPYMAFIINCSIPNIPDSIDLGHISLLSRDGLHRATMPVEDHVEARRNDSIAVCVKPITGEFYVSRLIEWVEMFRMVGVQDFFIYNTDLFGAARFVLDYYGDLGIIRDVRFPFLTAALMKIESRMSVTPQQRYALYQQIYLVAYHDCFYRIRNKFEYVVVVDLDEVLLPVEDISLLDLIHRSRKTYPKASALMFNTAWHFQEYGVLEQRPGFGDPGKAEDKIPDFLYAQKYARASPPDVASPKSILITDACLTFNFHGVVTMVDPDASAFMMAWWKYGYVHHFRSGSCRSYLEHEECDTWEPKVAVDRVITRYYDRILPRVAGIVDHLQLTL